METNQYSPPTPVPNRSERLWTNERIPAADGVELIGDLYLPGGTPPFPAIVEITPYGAQGQAKLGEIYATRGYLFLAVDARGRYRSGGQWDPVSHDQQDGHAVLRWLIEQPLCNGRIGTRGHSYCGYNQLLCAIDAPAQLKAMVVCVAPGDPFDNVPFRAGAYDMGDLMWLLSMSGRACTDDAPAEELGIKRFGAEELETNPYEVDETTQLDETDRKRAAALSARVDAALSASPFGDIDLRFGIRHDTFREWIAHWRLDDYWQARSAIRQLGRSAVPTLHISGWWDNNGRGATTAYRAMRTQARDESARERQRLLMGPWNHDLKAPDCSDLPGDEAAMVRRAALRDELNDELAWFDWHLKDIVPGPSTRARAMLFVTGLFRWFEFADWPPSQTQPRDYFLAGRASGQAGVLAEAIPGDGAGESGYTFNPNEPTPFADPRLQGERAPFDNAPLQRERRDMKVFDTPALTAPLALVGEPSLVLYARADVPDFDLCVKLLDVYPDGRAIYLTDGVMRARFRGGWQNPEPVVPGTVDAYRIDLWHIAHVLRTGHALRLEIASAAFRRFDVNPCTGGELASETERRTAEIWLVHTSQYPSHLTLPVCHDTRLGQALPEGAPQ